MNTWKSRFFNDLESVTFGLHPELKKIKNYLYSLGAIYASMTGSVSAIYGFFEKKPNFSNRLYRNMCVWEGYFLS